MVMLTLLLSGCDYANKIVASERGLCDGLAPKVDNLNDALLLDGGPKSLLAGDELIRGFDSGCYGTMD
jgi:hypothetical protein